MALFVTYEKVAFDLFCYILVSDPLSHISASQYHLTPWVHFVRYHGILLLLVWIPPVTYTLPVNRWKSCVVSNKFLFKLQDN